MKKLGFGFHGWILIVIGLFVTFCTVFAAGALNVIVPRFAERFAWDPAMLLTFVSFTGLISAAVSVIFSVVIAKRGNGKEALAVSLGIAFAGILLWGTASELWQYILFELMAVIGVSTAFTHGLPILIGNWFPKRKGVVIGIVTIGQNIGTMTIAWLLTGVWGLVGFGWGFAIMSLFALVPLLLLIFGIKDKPEYQGCFPDNDSSFEIGNVEERKKRNALIEKTSPFTAKKLLKSRNLWLVILSNGFMQLVCVGIMSNTVLVSTSFGNSQGWAMGLVTWSAAIAIPSSIILGYIDSKTGTRKASLIVAVFGFATTSLCFFHGNTWAAVCGVIAFGFFSGTTNNLVNSLLVSIYGRLDFKKPLVIVQPCVGAFRCLGSLIIAVSLQLTGGYEMSFGVFTVLMAASIVMIVLMSDKCVGRTEEEILIVEEGKKK